MQLVATDLRYIDHGCNTGDCPHMRQDECDAELAKIQVIDCPASCPGCTCFQDPPCSHCTDGHGFIAEEEQADPRDDQFHESDIFPEMGCK